DARRVWLSLSATGREAMSAYFDTDIEEPALSRSLPPSFEDAVRLSIRFGLVGDRFGQMLLDQQVSR
ncbi:MAG: hypothetical protein ABIV36_18430, partial [Sphingobium limneticum]